MGTRSHWYSDEAGPRPGVPPLRSWSTASLLLAVLAAVFILQLLTGIGRYLALDMATIQRPLCWYQFLTYALVHDESDFGHLLMNGLVLFFFAPAVEEDLGGRRPFLVFCAVAAVVSSLSFVLVEAFCAPNGRCLVGASGVGYACLVAFGALRPQARVFLLVFPMRAWVLATIIMTIALYATVMGSGDGVAHVAHLGGGAFGFACVRYRRVLDGALIRYRQQRASAELKRRGERKQEVDRLLEKISRSGIGSLTRAERRFLDSASRDLRGRR